jgi:nucleolar protein 12
VVTVTDVADSDSDEANNKARRKRKRKHEDEELEDKFLKRFAKDLDKAVPRSDGDSDSADERASNGSENSASGGEDEDMLSPQEDNDDAVSDDDDEIVPVHESLNPSTVVAAEASRTVFLGNVSTTAITSKSAKRTFTTHISSFLASLSKTADSDPKLVSLRFRSTPYESKLPSKKAAFAKGAVMDATSPNTNAYAVYSSPAAARAACAKLNGTVVLGRHLRVDNVAHPAAQDPKRCVFVGNLGFTAIELDEPEPDREGEDGEKKRKKRKLAAQDPEEGLWTHFSTCGTVESVRVIRDAATRIGKGFAYVQFTDANAVERALLLEGQKFPPMLPRKLRVTRARKTKKRDTPYDKRAATEEERSLRGRAGKLLGKGGARQLKVALKSHRPGKPNGDAPVVFEGHRASSKEGNKGLKFGKKKSKPSNRSTKRAASWRKEKYGL